MRCVNIQLADLLISLFHTAVNLTPSIPGQAAYTQRISSIISYVPMSLVVVTFLGHIPLQSKMTKLAVSQQYGKQLKYFTNENLGNTELNGGYITRNRKCFPLMILQMSFLKGR